MIALFGAALAADCPTPVGADRWAQELSAAERGYGALDPAAFGDHLDAASLDLPCLAAVVRPADAARYHALLALRLYADGDTAGTQASLDAARAADPAWAFPEAVVPAGHEVRAMSELGALGYVDELPPPDGVTVWLDGREADVWTTNRPVIVQIVGAAGLLRSTAYVSAGSPLPDYPRLAPPPLVVTAVVPEPAPVPAPVPVPVVPDPAPAPLPPPVPTARRSPKWGFLAGAGVAGGVSGVLYGFAADSARRFAAPLDPDDGREELLAIRSRTNGLVIGSVAVGAVAAAGATLFVVSL